MILSCYTKQSKIKSLYAHYCDRFITGSYIKTGYVVGFNMNFLLSAAAVYFGPLDFYFTHLARSLNDAGVFNNLFWYITWTGSASFMVITIVALYLGGARKEALVFAVVWGISSVLTLGMKGIIARPRPNDLGIAPIDQAAFPSGHAMDAFALATTMSIYHQKFRYAMFAWALLIGFSRLYLGFHYFTDVIAGALIGSAISFFVTRAALHRDKEISFISRREPLSLESWRSIAKLPYIFIVQMLAIVRAISIKPKQRLNYDNCKKI